MIVKIREIKCSIFISNFPSEPSQSSSRRVSSFKDSSALHQRYILKSVAPYSNTAKKCRLYPQEKFEILSYSNPDELLSKRSNLFQSAVI